MDDEVRIAELLTALSLASDLGQGQPMEWELRGCLLALGLADRLGLDEVEGGTVYDLALLRYIGCTSHAHEVAIVFGDEIDARRRLMAFDLNDKGATLRMIVGTAGAGRSLPRRIATVVATLAAGTGPVAEGFRASCEVAETFGRRLGFTHDVTSALALAFERWDGQGFPDHAAGEAIPRPMRVVQVAQDIEALARVAGVADAVDIARKRAGSMYDSSVVASLASDAASLFAALDGIDAWQAVLDAEPVPRRTVKGAGLDDALLVLADYADLKSPYTGGHSRAVADLAAAAAASAGLDVSLATEARRAGLIHELGTGGIPNSIWDKPGPLTVAEWERVRMHPYLTERILGRAPALAALAPIAGAHHERADGSGYHKALRAHALTPTARLLAAADTYVAITEERAHRPARPPADAAAELVAMVTAGTFDADAVDAVLGAAGHGPRPRRAWPNGLTDREVEVLGLLVRGRTAKDVARELSISVKTVGSHVEHLYAKIGVSTRGAAALFAIQHDLVRPEP